MLELLGFTFIRPWWLLALMPAGILLVLLYRYGWQQSAWEQLLPRPLQVWLLQRPSNSGHGLRFAALGTTWTLVIFALAGPALETTSESQRMEDSALIIVADLSRHMLSNDLPPNRLERTRYKIRSLIQDHADTHLSLIVYAGSAHRVTPLSSDHATLTNLLSALDPTIMPVDGQAVGDALELARQVVERRPRNSSHVLLLTSGLDSNGLQELAQHAADLGPQLSILGVGTRSGAPVPQAEGGFLRDTEGRILLPRLNSQQLASLARQHGARYHDITIGDRDLNYLLQPLQVSTQNTPSERRALTDYGYWLVLLLLPIAALGARRGWLGFLFIAAWLPTDSHALTWTDLWQRADQQAMQLLQQQQPVAAAERFNDPTWQAWALYQAGNYQQSAEAWAILAQAQPDDPEHYFNRGTALAMTGDYSAALEAYEHALTLAPEHHAARHNRKLIEDYLEELQQQQAEHQTEENNPVAPPIQDNVHRDNNNPQPPNTPSSLNPHESPDLHSQSPGVAEKNAGIAGNDGISSPLTDSAGADKDFTDTNNQPGLSNDVLNGQIQSHKQQRSTSERQHSLEQWLLEVQDNPAELLRRKFLYQHLQQQDASP